MYMYFLFGQTSVSCILVVTNQICDIDGSVEDSGVRIAAHENAISYLAFNVDGTLLATSSIKGTCLRVFNTASGALVRELRRGIEPSDIKRYRCVAN